MCQLELCIFHTLEIQAPVMKETEGRANPALAERMLKEKIG